MRYRQGGRRTMGSRRADPLDAMGLVSRDRSTIIVIELSIPRLQLRSVRRCNSCSAQQGRLRATRASGLCELPGLCFCLDFFFFRARSSRPLSLIDSKFEHSRANHGGRHGKSLSDVGGAGE